MVSYTKCYLLLITIISPASIVSRAVLGGAHYPHSAGEESEGVKAIQSFCRNVHSGELKSHQITALWKLPQGAEKTMMVHYSNLPEHLCPLLLGLSHLEKYNSVRR